MTDDIKDITPEEAVAQHEEGSLHCCTPNRWHEIESRFDLTMHPWLQGKIGMFSLNNEQDNFTLICIDTDGMDPEHVNIMLAKFYDTRDEDEPGVMVLEAGSKAADTLYKAKERGQKKRRRRR